MTPRFSATLSQSANIPALTSNTGTINIGGQRDDHSAFDKVTSVSASGSIAYDSGLISKYINHVMHGTAGSDQLHGTAGNDTMYGDGGNDSYILTGGSDKAYGGNASDLFFIESGNHKASGGAGNDMFQVEGAGNHTLTGGTGADNYLFMDGFSGHTTITDFNGAEGDHITFAKPVVSVGWNSDCTGIDFTFTDGSTASVLGGNADIYHYVQFGF